MKSYGIVLLAIGLAMDAFAVSICKGITIKEKLNKNGLVIATWFGTFQGIMPLIGYFLMNTVNGYLEGIKEYVIFGLLAYIGIAMMVEAFKKEEMNSSIGFKEMLALSIATSLDALSVGMTISLMGINIILAVFVIAAITFSLCFIGVRIGSKFGNKYKSKAEMLGGIILILIGLKVLIEYLV